MTQIQLDEVLRQKLGGAANPVEILDETGALVGHFVPASDAENSISNERLMELAEKHQPPRSWYEGEEEQLF